MDKTLQLDQWPPNGTTDKQRARAARSEAAPAAAVDGPSEDRVRLDITYVFNAPGDPAPMQRADLEALAPEVLRAHAALKAGEGDVCDGGIPMLGWQSLPETITAADLTAITQAVEALRDRIDAYVSVGIGGSYLGIAATLSALTHSRFNALSRAERGGAPEIYFLGQNMDPDYFRDTLDVLRGKRVAINVISKSGTTTETAIAFRILRRLLEETWGPEAHRYILATTDPQHGALRTLAREQGYQTFVVPDDIGGRFSVLSDVGLVGIAMAGIDIAAFVAGFRTMKQRTDSDDFWQNPALVHAAVRTLAWRKGKKVEVVATNSAALLEVARFMEQLFPESEGHGGQGLWVAPAMYSEKLHANGQMVQQGERNVIETFLRLQTYDSHVAIPFDPDDLDALNYLPQQGHGMGVINDLVVDGPAYAHYTGGVPNMTLEIPRRSAYCLGQLFFLLERSVAISGTLLGHNPFIQPGVQAYKRAMFALAGKPGYQDATVAMRQELAARPRICIG